MIFTMGLWHLTRNGAIMTTDLMRDVKYIIGIRDEAPETAFLKDLSVDQHVDVDHVDVDLLPADGNCRIAHAYVCAHHATAL